MFAPDAAATYEMDEFRSHNGATTAAVNHVTLSPRGEFYLNQGAMMNLGYPAAVRLMYDKGERLIGIAAAPLNAKASYELRSKYAIDAPARIFRATSFCRHLGILPDRTIMFRDPEIRDGVLVLDLKATVYAPRRAAPLEEPVRLNGSPETPDVS